MAEINLENVQWLNRVMWELLSDYGVDRAGIDAAIDIAIEFSEREMAN